VDGGFGAGDGGVNFLIGRGLEDFAMSNLSGLRDFRPQKIGGLKENRKEIAGSG
jgi:hypothetical protein